MRFYGNTVSFSKPSEKYSEIIIPMCTLLNVNLFIHTSHVVCQWRKSKHFDAFNLPNIFITLNVMYVHAHRKRNRFNGKEMPSKFSPRCMWGCVPVLFCNVNLHIVPLAYDNRVNYTTFTNFSMKYHLMCNVYTDVGGIK